MKTNDNRRSRGSGATIALVLSLLSLLSPPIVCAQATPGRADLAMAYLRMDRLYAAADSAGVITDSTRRRVNQTFDRATLSFFGGRFASAIASIDSSLQLLAAASGRPIPDVTAVPTTSRFAGDARLSLTLAAGTTVPLRLVAAPRVAKSKQPVGVLIALHGAGGEDNMFVDAYGQGLAAQLAADAGLIFVSPAATAFVGSAEPFDSLMTMLRRSYRIDTTRVYLMGHSMGAGAVARLVRERPQQIAAAACLAGGSVVAIPQAPPMLFIGAELDPIIPARNVKTAASGSPTATYEELAGEGHTLMVRRGVQRAVPWLVSQHR
jgi:predicted esterase